MSDMTGFQMSAQTDRKVLIAAPKLGSGAPQNGGIKIRPIIQRFQCAFGKTAKNAL
ncbi:hypothetical protein ACF1BQ_018590 [Bradyrhizobium sp. RDT10]